MTNGSSDATKGYQAPSAVKKSAKQRGFSPIWIVPIVAVLIGAFLVFRLVSETGPTITISFKEGAGLEAGKTKVKFKDVEVGSVTDVRIDDDMAGVTATVEMRPKSKKGLTDQTKFWVVRPRISAGNVSGLGTLLSGAYIGMDPSTDGKATKKFVGLERPPVIEFDDPGRHFKLRASKLGGIDFGAPVYYKQIRVGRIINYKLQDDGDISLDVFVEEPYDKRVNSSTRFWNASGIDVTIGADGVEIYTESMIAMLAGGIAFGDPSSLEIGQPVEEGHEFHLYATENASRQRKYTEKRRVVMYFEDQIRGLLPGAPVEMFGYKVGEVLDINFEFNRDTGEIRIPVLVELEPERVSISGDSSAKETLEMLVANGMRAQLKSGNIVLGKLLVDMSLHPDEPEAFVDFSGQYPVIPTIRSPLGEILSDARALIDELRQTGASINDMLASEKFKSSMGDLASTISHLEDISAQLDESTAPQVTEVLNDVHATLEEAREMLSTSSTTRNEINRLLVELAQAARSIRLMADYLEQNPESIIKGKD